MNKWSYSARGKIRLNLVHISNCALLKRTSDKNGSNGPAFFVKYFLLLYYIIILYRKDIGQYKLISEYIKAFMVGYSLLAYANIQWNSTNLSIVSG